MGEGGFLSALWKMAEASEVGLEADFRKVPIRQETIEVCEIFALNPYKLQADGAVLIESAEVKHWYRDFAMRDLWQRSSVRQTVAMTGFSTVAAVPDIWNVRQRMNCSNFSKSNCRKLKRQFSKKRQTINNKRNKNKMAKIKYCTSGAGNSLQYGKYRPYLRGNRNQTPSY